MKNLFLLILAGLLGGIIALFGNYFINTSSQQTALNFQKDNVSLIRATNHNTNTPIASTIKAESIDFTTASEKTINAVVHVKNTSTYQIESPFSFFFGGGNTRPYEQIGTGSGVIISGDGHIVTNFHVINGADEIEITLNNKKSYPAKIIGKDRDNDIALLKIDAGDNLPYLVFSDSDNVKVGEWVLAVGNPYNLTSTVTAGIISAKGRDIEDPENKIESFLQTDAAVNSGNSGGALVNTRGELIGINTAISSATGGFVGYSFAVPSNITKKIVEDLMEYGSVKKAMLGIEYSMKKNNTEGVVIASVLEGGAAEKGGLKKYDIIMKIDNKNIKSFADLKGKLNEKRPNETVEVVVLRNGKEITKKIKLLPNTSTLISAMGMRLAPLTKKEARKNGLNSGVKITSLRGSQFRHTGIKRGAILLEINDIRIENITQAKELLENSDRYVRLKILQDNRKMVYVLMK